jgi:hypothetical protein
MPCRKRNMFGMRRDMMRKTTARDSAKVTAKARSTWRARWSLEYAASALGGACSVIGSPTTIGPERAIAGECLSPRALTDGEKP